MICNHFRKPAAGDGVQHPEAAVVGVGVLQGAPQIHLVHGGKPCPVQGAVGLVQPVVIGLFRGGKGRIGLHPSADERPLLGGALGRKIPQDAGLHGGALVDQLVHDAAVQPGDGGAFIGHDLHQPVFLQLLQNHPDHAAGGRKAGTQRVFAQQGAGADGQIDDLPFQHGVNFSIGSILFHTSHLMKMMYSFSGLALSASPCSAALPKGEPLAVHADCISMPRPLPLTDSPGRGRWHEVPEGEQGGFAKQRRRGLGC